MLARFTRPQRIATAVAASALIVLAAVVAAADPLARWATREALGRLDGYSAEFASVDVRLGELTYVLRDLRLQSARDDAPITSGSIARAEVSLDGGALLRGDLVARVVLDQPKVHVVRREPAANPQLVRAVARGSLPRAVLKQVEVRGGELVWTDLTTNDAPPRLRVHDVELTLRDYPLDPSAHADVGGRASLEVRARVERSGDLHAVLDASPAAERLTFSGRARLQGLKLEDISRLITANSSYTPEGGTFRATVEVRAEAGELDGEVRPVVASPEVSTEGSGLAAAVKELAADAAVAAATEDVAGAGEGLTARIPIGGSVEEPARPIATFLKIVAAGLGRGLSETLSVTSDASPLRVASPRGGP
jgi:hypothetical protein